MSTHHPERGAALAMAMVFVAVVGAATLTLSNRSRVAAASTVLESGAITTRAAADGGLETARARLAADPTWSGGELDVGGCAVTVRVETATPGEWTVAVTAREARGGHPATTAFVAELRAGARLPSVAAVR